MDVVIGDRDVKLKCEVTGGDDCMATWYHNGREVRQGRRHRCRFNGQQATLTLTEIGEEDGGLYECVLANSTGEVRTSCTLTTQGQCQAGLYGLAARQRQKTKHSHYVHITVIMFTSSKDNISNYVKKLNKISKQE